MEAEGIPWVTPGNSNSSEAIYLYGPPDNLTSADYYFQSGDLTAKLQAFVDLVDPTWKDGGRKLLSDGVASLSTTTTTYRNHEYFLTVRNGGGLLSVKAP